ncbi:MAG: SDR family oxidoreductase [Pseudomonadota bacterium]
MVASLENTIAFVTGAGRGLGLALVEELIQKGCKKVYAGVRSQSHVDRLLDLDTEHLIPLQLDITQENDIIRAVNVAGDCNLLINNAGIYADGILLDASMDELRQLIEVNYFGTLNMIRHFVPGLKRNANSAIVNILSISALANVPAIGGYSASKAAAQSLTQSFRQLLANQNIRVHGVYPGPIDTDMTGGLSVPKANVGEVAVSILDGLINGDEDIFPDKMSRQGGQAWRSDPKVLERQLALG